jgi:DNA replication and repair protein RecF
VLSQLTISQLRNIEQCSLAFKDGINLFVGSNGSGKTSVLEAIYLLALGRSFRTRTLKNIIQFGKPEFLVTARTVTATPVGLRYNANDGLHIRLNSAPLKKLSDLAAELPTQYISANCHQFFELGPKFRRQQLDWGLFHVEPRFNTLWQSYKKIIKQRNSALKNRLGRQEITLWDEQLIQYATEIDRLRDAYLNKVLEKFVSLFSHLCPTFDKAKFSLRYLKGWPKEADLRTVLRENFERDLQLSYTRNGIHAADWSIRIDGINPLELLSRGQQKLFYIALCVAQAEIISEYKQQQSMFVIDDISSELDVSHQMNVINLLRKNKMQCFITTTNLDLTEKINKESEVVFHVEHGVVSSNA